MRTLRDGYPMRVKSGPKSTCPRWSVFPPTAEIADAIGINVIPASTPERRIMRYELKTRSVIKPMLPSHGRRGIPSIAYIALEGNRGSTSDESLPPKNWTSLAKRASMLT
jgi:hypothetical protein